MFQHAWHVGCFCDHGLYVPQENFWKRATKREGKIKGAKEAGFADVRPLTEALVDESCVMGTRVTQFGLL